MPPRNTKGSHGRFEIPNLPPHMGKPSDPWDSMGGEEKSKEKKTGQEERRLEKREKMIYSPLHASSFLLSSLLVPPRVVSSRSSLLFASLLFPSLSCSAPLCSSRLVSFLLSPLFATISSLWALFFLHSFLGSLLSLLSLSPFIFSVLFSLLCPALAFSSCRFSSLLIGIRSGPRGREIGTLLGAICWV